MCILYLFHIHLPFFFFVCHPPFLSGHFFCLMLHLIPPFLDYDFGDIFPVLQSMPSADWEGGTWLFPIPIMSSSLPVPRSKSLTILHAHFPMDLAKGACLHSFVLSLIIGPPIKISWVLLCFQLSKKLFSYWLLLFQDFCQT